MAVDPVKARKFHRLLFRWYQHHQRNLPWRKTRDPYKILVSEVMLQQTQVRRVIPRYLAWIDRYPTAESLAAAKTADMLRLWSGLGYNRRAVYIKRAVGIIVDDWKGKWPREVRELMKLPGVGRYTAAAILSFAFNQDVPLADVNMARVIGRIFVGADWKKLSEKQMLSIVEQVLPKNKSRIFPHAVMDLGSALLTNNPSLEDWRQAFPELFVGEPSPEKQQQSWQGSNRQIRGAILRQLHSREKKLRDLAREIAIPYDRLEIILQSLANEGLIERKADRVFLPV
jgi:A/G-specific adenine glycosylase